DDGDWILSGGDDGTIMVWNSETGIPMATLVSVPASDDWLVATPDGLFDGSPPSWNLLLWRFGGDTFSVLPVEAYFNEFYYPGLLIKVWAGNVLKASSNSTIEATIPIVAGENRLSAYAFNNDNVKTADASLSITGADGLKRMGTAYVLSIGVEQYQNAQYNLHY